jgi:Ca2+-transporting ATPase
VSASRSGELDAPRVPVDSTAPVWHALAVEDVVRLLGTDVHTGLSEQAARERLAASGPNELAARRPPPAWVKFLGQFANTMIVVLLAAAAVTVVIGDLKDTVVILSVVVLNAAIGYAQEHRAEEAMAALRRLSVPFARVVRDGAVRSIPTRELVPGDVVRLEVGDVVPADARLVEAPNLRVNEAPLTGEAMPVDKSAAVVRRERRERDAALTDQSDMVFKGTAVTYGRGVGVVTATAMDTALGRIAGLLEAHSSPTTPMQRRLARLGRDIAVAAVAMCGVVFVIGYATGESATRMLLTSISLAAAAIPESLPAVVTISLALGAQRMARHHAIVRVLPAVETLGSVTVIATDKTGTLTQGVMLVERVWADGDEWAVTGDGYAPEGVIRPLARADEAALARLVRAAALCNDATLIAPAFAHEPWSVAGDPTDGALVALAEKAGVETSAVRHDLRRLAEMPFDSTVKRMTTVHALPTGKVLALTKGAIETVAPLLRDRDARGADQARVYASAGYRVLALAGAEYGSVEAALSGGRHELYGLVAFADPPRPEAAAAVAAAHRAGIRTVMITGDHPATATAIADRIGVRDGGRVMTGRELGLEGSDDLARHVADVAVYARTTSEQKLDIVDAWKRTGAVVAMTGDGVNDAPALRLADIGVAMGVGGSEVAKEAADMVLADDNFATIVDAIREGRRIDDNVRRFVQYGLTGGSAEIAVMAAAPLLGLPLALLPAQILWINLLTHGLPGVALGVEQAEADTMERPPRQPGESIFGRGLWQRIAAAGLLTATVALALAVWVRAAGGPWRTMLFTSLVFLQLGDAWAVRSGTVSAFRLGIRSNRFLFWSVLGMIAAQLAAVYAPPLRRLLGTDPLGAVDLLVVSAVSSITFLAIEGEKRLRRRTDRRRTTATGRGPFRGRSRDLRP